MGDAVGEGTGDAVVEGAGVGIGEGAGRGVPVLSAVLTVFVIPLQFPNGSALYCIKILIVKCPCITLP